jgi:chaperonin GroEL
MLAAGFSAIDLKRGIDYAVAKTIDELKKIAVPVTNEKEIKQVGVISANGEEEIGNLLLSAIQAVGQDGIVTVEEAKGFNTSLNVVDGSQINRGYLSPYFITNQDKMTCEFSNPYVLICNKKISALKDLMPILEKILTANAALLVISDDVDGDAMQGLVLNRLKASLNVCVIKSPGFGESRVSLLGDLGILLGCEVFSDSSSSDFKNIELEDLGKCKKVIISKMDTVFVGCKGDKSMISERVNSIKCQLNEFSSTADSNEESLLRLRLSRLSGGVAVLHVGGATEGELKERRDRVDDALNATRAAIEEGIVPGGGVSLVRASNKVSIPKKMSMTGFEAGIKIIKNACTSPLKQIVENSGGTPDVVLDRILSLSLTHGYDAYLDKYGDMFDMGIIDPLKVVRCALENSASAAGILLTIGCAIIDDIDPEASSDSQLI